MLQKTSINGNFEEKVTGKLLQKHNFEEPYSWFRKISINETYK